MACLPEPTGPFTDHWMPDFEIYVDDDRYSVPSLYLITARNPARAKAIAEQLWLNSEHHRGVELRQSGGARISALGSLAPVATGTSGCVCGSPPA